MEPGREVVAAELATGDDGLPWLNERRFLEKVIALGVVQWEAATDGICFYDRSLIDAVTWFERQPEPVSEAVAALVQQYRYCATVFLAPPWPVIFTNDDARRHMFEDALTEYEALLASYPAKGYDVVILPKTGIKARADWLLDHLEEC